MDNFDKHFNRITNANNNIRKFAIVGIIGGWVVSLGVLGFIGWVVIKILQSQGII